MNFFNYYFLEKENNYQIYVDLDGVLTNFDKAWLDLEVSEKSFDDYIEEKGKKYAFAVLKKVGKTKFWSEMPWMPEGKELWDYIKKYNPIVLTTPANFEESKEGKKEWVEKELGEDIKIIFSKSKHKYASSNKILIDDKKENIDNWIEAGGIGIRFESTNQVIKELKKLGL